MKKIHHFYQLVRAFWAAFFVAIQKLISDHRKGIAVFCVFCAVVVVIVGIGFLKFSDSSTFCGLCHQMGIYIQSWKASSHRNVACTTCHYEPGFFNHLKGKWVNGQVSLAYFLSGKRTGKYHAEISDASCLQCHKIKDLQKNMTFKGVAFTHGNHLGELRRGMKLRCTTCHAQIVQGAHLTVNEINCFICHYFKAGPKGEEECISCPIGGCTSCHVEPKGDIKLKDWNFNHRKYIARKVACEKCHLNVINGDGHVQKEEKCMECHSRPDLLATKLPSEVLHRNHVTNHKIECASCHSFIRHEMGQIRTMVHSPTNCDKCHTQEIHLGPRDMYQGKSGIGVADSPSLMYTAHIDCVACHHTGGMSRAALETTNYVERALGESCVACHGEGWNTTLDHWKALLSRMESETNQRIFNAQKALQEAQEKRKDDLQIKKAQTLINEARHNYSFILLGRGVHNIEYAIKLLNVADSKVEQSLALIDKAYKAREIQTQLTCTSLCHIGMERRNVPFNDITFAHKTHIEKKGLKCLDCHSPRENHGKTFLKNCADCHHRKEAVKVKCEDCHISVKRILQGKGGIGVKEKPGIKLTAVTCTDCHQGIQAKKKDTFEEIKKRCVECHDPSFGEKAVQWKAGPEELIKKVAPKMERVKAVIARIDKQGGHTFEYRKLFGEAEVNYNLVVKGKGVHNPEYARDLLTAADKWLDEAEVDITKRKKEEELGKMQGPRP